MKNLQVQERLIGCIEEEFQGYTIFIENNSDLAFSAETKQENLF